MVCGLRSHVRLTEKYPAPFAALNMEREAFGAVFRILASSGFLTTS